MAVLTRCIGSGDCHLSVETARLCTLVIWCEKGNYAGDSKVRIFQKGQKAKRLLYFKIVPLPTSSSLDPTSMCGGGPEYPYELRKQLPSSSLRAFKPRSA
ncbi:hypothetical protein WAI453_000705 [Rhynchosporium graminicola]